MKNSSDSFNADYNNSLDNNISAISKKSNSSLNNNINNINNISDSNNKSKVINKKNSKKVIKKNNLSEKKKNKKTIKKDLGITLFGKIKKKEGRPTKLYDFFEAAEKILFEDNNALIFTDSELLFEVNQLLPVEKKISETTFKSWKSLSQKNKLDDDKGLYFLSLLKTALNKQKQNLFKKLNEEKQSGLWTKWAWIIERKFSDWNLRHIGEIDHTTKGKPFSTTIAFLTDELSEIENILSEKK